MPSITISAQKPVRALPYLLLLCLLGCRPKQESPPAGLLGKEQMTRILIRTHLLESDLEFSYLPADSAKLIYAQEEKKIFEKEGINEEAFRKSYNFYLRNPKYLDVIYAAVVDSLSLREAVTTQRETVGDEPDVVPPQPAPTPAPPTDSAKK